MAHQIRAAVAKILRVQPPVTLNAPLPTAPEIPSDGKNPRLKTRRGAMNHIPARVRSGIMVLRATDQRARRFSAEDLPVFRLATTS
jgi:hypothetical protein